MCQTFSLLCLCWSYLFNTKTDQVHMWCVHMPCDVGNVMRMGVFGSNVIKGVLLDETLR